MPTVSTTVEKRMAYTQAKESAMHEPFGSEHIPVKMYRGADRLVIATPMAGLEPEDILVEVTTDNQIGIHGLERGSLKDEKDVLLDEWNPGPYHRRLALPESVNAELANVTFRNGVLVIALPLAAQTRAAQLSLTTIGPGHGERIGSHGHPVQPTTAEAHHNSGAQDR